MKSPQWEDVADVLSLGCDNTRRFKNPSKPVCLKENKRFAIQVWAITLNSATRCLNSLRWVILPPREFPVSLPEPLAQENP